MLELFQTEGVWETWWRNAIWDPGPEKKIRCEKIGEIQVRSVHQVIVYPCGFLFYSLKDGRTTVNAPLLFNLCMSHFHFINEESEAQTDLASVWLESLAWWAAEQGSNPGCFPKFMFNFTALLLYQFMEGLSRAHFWALDPCAGWPKWT